MQKPTVGRIVLYSFECKGEVVTRPAIIVRTWGDTPANPVNLQVFADGDGTPHYNDGLPNVFWKTSIHQSEGPEADRFHFPQIEQ